MENNITNLKTLIGDASKTVLTDDQLDEFIAEAENVYRAASKACFALSAYYAHKASMSVDIISFQYTQRANSFRDLAKEYSSQADSFVDTTESSSAEFIYVPQAHRNVVFEKNMFVNGGRRCH
jgi:DNA repair ATPase RecN